MVEITQNKQEVLFSLLSLNKNSISVVVGSEKKNSNSNIDSNKTNNNNEITEEMLLRLCLKVYRLSLISLGFDSKAKDQ